MISSQSRFGLNDFDVSIHRVQLSRHASTRQNPPGYNPRNLVVMRVFILSLWNSIWPPSYSMTFAH